MCPNSGRHGLCARAHHLHLRHEQLGAAGDQPDEPLLARAGLVDRGLAQRDLDRLGVVGHRGVGRDHGLDLRHEGGGPRRVGRVADVEQGVVPVDESHGQIPTFRTLAAFTTRTILISVERAIYIYYVILNKIIQHLLQ